MTTQNELRGYELTKWKITDKDLEDWKCLHPSFPRHKATDCTINTLHFLKVLNRFDAEIKAQHKNTNQNLATEMDILNELFDKLKIERVKSYRPFSFEINKESENFLLSNLRPGEATLINMYRPIPEPGHTIVVAVTHSGQLVFLDPQQSIPYLTNEEIRKMIKDQRYVKFSLIFKSKRHYHTRKETELKLRKNSSERENPKKRRKLNSRTRKSSSSSSSSRSRSRKMKKLI